MKFGELKFGEMKRNQHKIIADVQASTTDMWFFVSCLVGVMSQFGALPTTIQIEIQRAVLLRENEKYADVHESTLNQGIHSKPE